MYKQLGKQLATSHPSVVVAKFDATANDLPTNFEVSGFPTIYYVKAEETENPVLFEGDRTLEGLKVCATFLDIYFLKQGFHSIKILLDDKPEVH